MMTECFIQRDGGLRTGSVREARAVALAAVTVERELRHDEQAAANIRERAVHFVVFVREYTHFNRFIGQINRIVHGITVCDAEQDKEALSDLSVNPAVDRHRRVGDSLYQRPHSYFLIS